MSTLHDPMSDIATRHIRDKLIDIHRRCLENRYSYFPENVSEMIHKPQQLRVVVFSTHGADCGRQVDLIAAAVKLKGGRIAALVHDSEDHENRHDPKFFDYRQITTADFFAETVAFAGCLIVDRTSTWFPGIRDKLKLKQSGFNVLRIEQFLNAPGLEAAGGYYREHSDVMLRRFEEFLALDKYWKDNFSRQTYYYALAAFISMNFKYFALHCGDYKQRYFSPDIDLKLNSGTVYADCGSHDGREVMIFAERVRHQFKAVHAFEPDRHHYINLVNTINQYIARRGGAPIYCHELAVSDCDGYLNAEGYGTHITVTDQAGESGKGLHVCKLDNILDELSHLRLEIEGSELAALNGARRLILKDRPTLTVSAYHKATDFLDLLHFIQSTGLDYQFSLRHQGLEPGVLCIYAV